jgi:uncharacterized protein YdeI (BOF family)
MLSNNRRYFMKLRRTALAGAAVVVATVGCLVGLMAATALAADTTTTTGVGAVAKVSTTVSAIVANPVRDQVVEVSGIISQGTEGNEYTLTSGADTIKIELGPVWFKAHVLTLGQSVTVTGEVGLGKDGTAAAEIDVFNVKDDKGATIADVRSEAGGKPAWAGGGGPHGNGATPGADAPDDATDSD